MSRYNSNYGSHDQLRESRELGMEAARERDALKKRVEELEDQIKRLQEWKDLAYEMRNRSWWAMRNKVLVKFDDMHKKDWQQR